MKARAAIVLCALALALAAAQPAEAGAEWCARYSGIGEQNCGFYTFEQCRTDVSGIGGVCFPNPAHDRRFSKPRWGHPRLTRHFWWS
jgi:hypothetical protein